MGTSGGKKAFTTIGGNEDMSDRAQAVCDLHTAQLILTPSSSKPPIDWKA